MILQELASKHCWRCEGTEPKVRREIEQALRELAGWPIVDDSIEKEFGLRSSLGGLDLPYTIGRIAEEQDHSDILKWRRVKLMLSTDSIKGFEPQRLHHGREVGARIQEIRIPLALTSDQANVSP